MARKMWLTPIEDVEKPVEVDEDSIQLTPSERKEIKMAHFSPQWLAEHLGEKCGSKHWKDAYLLQRILFGDKVQLKGEPVPMFKQVMLFNKYKGLIEDYRGMRLVRAKVRASEAAENIGTAMSQKDMDELRETNIGSLAGALKTTAEICDVQNRGEEKTLDVRDRGQLLSAAADALQGIANANIQGLTINIDNRTQKLVVGKGGEPEE